MKIVIAGDYAPITPRIIEQIDNTKYEEMFPIDLVSEIKDVDYSIVNFECPIADEDSKPIEKNGPALKCSPKSVDAIKYSGFQGVTLANNHILDQGIGGLRKTVSCCKEANLDITGVGRNIEDASQILYVVRNGEKLAIINCCEHEFSIATEDKDGAYPLSPVLQYNQIIEARRNANYVVVIVHGGHEHCQLPSPRMKETYRFFIDAGADAVVNHHQHCFSGYEIYNGKPIVYGLGNFAFDWDGKRNSKWNQGYLVKLDLKYVVEIDLIPYEQYGDSASVQLLKYKKDFEENILRLNEIIGDDRELKRQTDLFFESRYSIIASILEPSQNRWVRSAINRHLLPSMLSKEWLIKLLNIIDCEAHRDTLLYYLKHFTRE